MIIFRNVYIHIYTCNNDEKEAIILKKMGSEWYLGEFLEKKWKGKMLQLCYNLKLFFKIMHGKLENFSPQYCLPLCFLIYPLLCYLISWIFPQIYGVSWWMHKTYSFYDTALILGELVQEKVSKAAASLISQHSCLFVL